MLLAMTSPFGVTRAGEAGRPHADAAAIQARATSLTP
jgi:hypothetical protein